MLCVVLCDAEREREKKKREDSWQKETERELEIYKERKRFLGLRVYRII